MLLIFIKKIFFKYPKIYFRLQRLWRIYLKFIAFIKNKIIIFETRAELNIFKKIEIHCNTIFDVGAKDCIDLIKYSKGKKKKYFLFEVNPNTFLRLKKKLINFKKKRRGGAVENVRIFNLGLSNYNGYFNYFADSESFVNDPRTRLSDDSPKKLPVRTLKSFFNKLKIKNIDFIRIDTEQHDLFVLEGLKNLIKNIKFIQFELGTIESYGEDANIKRLVSISNYVELLKKNFTLSLIIDDQNPYFSQKKFINKDLVLLNKKNYMRINYYKKLGYVFNCYAISKKLNINNINFKILN
jgi:FkbM family methyltransferase